MDSSATSNKLEIGMTTLPMGHSIMADSTNSNSSNEKKEHKTFSMPRSSMFARLQAFLPQMEQANRKMEEDFKNGLGNQYLIEQVVEDSSSSSSSSDSDSDSESSSSSSSSDINMESNEIENTKPEIEIDFALAPYDLVEKIENYQGDCDINVNENTLSTLLKHDTTADVLEHLNAPQKSMITELPPSNDHEDTPM